MEEGLGRCPAFHEQGSSILAREMREVSEHTRQDSVGGIIEGHRKAVTIVLAEGCGSCTEIREGKHRTHSVSLLALRLNLS